MRAPWTVLRDANAELRRERDERAELIALRKERIVLRTMFWTGFAGLVVTLGLGTTETLPTGPVLATLVATLLTGGLAVVVATHRHGASQSAEAKRADATRSLVLLPATLVVTALIHWYVVAISASQPSTSGCWARCWQPPCCCAAGGTPT